MGSLAQLNMSGYSRIIFICGSILISRGNTASSGGVRQEI